MRDNKEKSATINTIDDLAAHADYSLMDTLVPDPQASAEGDDHDPRQVFSGHYVPVKPTPIAQPEYIAHSKRFFSELGLSDVLAHDEGFVQMFSGDLSDVPEPLRKVGWATGYALSIYGREYYEQCPFQTGNGYGDGRAISVFEGVLNGKRWEMQLKGAGRTPYCRGADGRAVLRSSIREFLAQEQMEALGVPTSRSLSLYVSRSEKVRRPWYSENSRSKDPDMMVAEPVAITTRVAPSFLRVGQIELFGRRARKQEHPKAMEELEQIVLHLIAREYADEIAPDLTTADKVLRLAEAFGMRLASLVAEWIRVGYCQGNFNSDNCAAGGFTLDYGPFGFMEMFDPEYQPWTGGGLHFSFLNQPNAAFRNFHVFCLALKPLLGENAPYLEALGKIHDAFPALMQRKMEQMWTEKLGLQHYDNDLFETLESLMIQTGVDYTIFFRELSHIPEDVEPLKKSFYPELMDDRLTEAWSDWLQRWRARVTDDASEKMKRVNPKYILREWHLVEAYTRAQTGDYALIHELQEVMGDPYAEQSRQTEEKYYIKKPKALFDVGGVSHISCSS
ncbi:MAG: protein adenylyltransferase SelO family protein [Sulfurovum sp.]|nr:protein adenylyltransferase SelO family protein [Sulfurovum sp.]